MNISHWKPSAVNKIQKHPELRCSTPRVSGTFPHRKDILLHRSCSELPSAFYIRCRMIHISPHIKPRSLRQTGCVLKSLPLHRNTYWHTPASAGYNPTFSTRLLPSNKRHNNDCTPQHIPNMPSYILDIPRP